MNRKFFTIITVASIVSFAVMYHLDSISKERLERNSSVTSERLDIEDLRSQNQTLKDDVARLERLVNALEKDLVLKRNSLLSLKEASRKAGTKSKTSGNSGYPKVSTASNTRQDAAWGKREDRTWIDEIPASKFKSW